jgi:hypothetical protein
METPKEYYYTYYSYEEWGRGYIGSRGCKCLPEEDIKYFGSYTDKTFKPTQKIILETYDTREKAFFAEIKLHKFFDVANNSNFANKSKLTTVGFYVERNKAIENGIKGGNSTKRRKKGIFTLTSKELSNNAKKSHKIQKKNKTGLFGMTAEEKSNAGKVGGKLGGKFGSKNTNSQKWICLETGFISNPGALSVYQKNRNIDIKKRKRLV